MSAALLTLGLASAAAAPAAAQPSALPSYATQEETLHGRIASVVDPHHITLYDDRGFVDNVTLGGSTAIDPTGLTLEPGQTVAIYGHADGPTFVASQIEASSQADPGAYSEDDPDAYPAPYVGPDPYWYGPYDPYGYFGPSIGIGFGFFGGYYGHGGHGYRYGGHGYGGHGYGGHGGYGYGHGSGGRLPLGRGAAAGGHGTRR